MDEGRLSAVNCLAIEDRRANQDCEAPYQVNRVRHTRERESWRSESSAGRRKKAKSIEISASRKRSYQGLTVDALAPNAEEGRGTLRKASGSRVQASIRGSPNGETPHGEPMGSVGRTHRPREGNLGN